MTKHQTLRGGFDDNFSGYPLITHYVRHAGEVFIKTLRFHYTPTFDD